MTWESPDHTSGIQTISIDYSPSSSTPPTVNEHINLTFNPNTCLAAKELAGTLSARLDEITYPGRPEPWNPNPPKRREPVLWASNDKGQLQLINYTSGDGTRSACVTSVNLHLYLEQRYVDAPPS